MGDARATGEPEKYIRGARNLRAEGMAGTAPHRRVPKYFPATRTYLDPSAIAPSIGPAA